MQTVERLVEVSSKMESAEEGKMEMEMEVDKEKPSGISSSILTIGSGPVVGQKLGESGSESSDKEQHVAEGKMEMEVEKEKRSGISSSILTIVSGLADGHKLGESSSDSNDKEKHVTVLKLRPGTALSKGSSLHMESVKLKNDLVHFMCVICNARFSTRDKCNKHVFRSHASSRGSMCPALRCIGSLEDYLQSSRSKNSAEHSPLSKYKKKQLSLPLLSRRNKGRATNTQTSRSSASAKKTNRSKSASAKKTTASRKSLSAKNANKSKKLSSAKKGQSDIVIVWNTDEMVNTKRKKYAHVFECFENATYMCFHCNREFPTWSICRNHIVRAHPFWVLKPMSSAKTKKAKKNQHSMDERGTSSEGRNGKVAESKKSVQASEIRFADGSMSLADKHGSNNRQVKKQHPNVDDLLKLSAHILAFPELDGKLTDADFNYLDDASDGMDGLGTSHGEFCEMSFDQNGDVSKVYQCSVCSRKFSTLGECGSHMKRDHVPNRDGQSARDDLMQGVYTVAEGDADDSGQESQDEVVQLDRDKAGREEKVNPEMLDGKVKDDDIVKGDITKYPCGEDIEISVNESDNIREDGDEVKKAEENVGMDQEQNIATEVKKGGEDGS